MNRDVPPQEFEQPASHPDELTGEGNVDAEAADLLWHPLPQRWMFLFRILGVGMAIAVILRVSQGKYPIFAAALAGYFLLATPSSRPHTVVNEVAHVLFWLIYCIWFSSAVETIYKVWTGQSLIRVLFELFR